MPTFDPKKPFTIVEREKVSPQTFNDVRDVSRGEALARGFEHGGTFGFSEEIAGLGAAAAEALLPREPDSGRSFFERIQGAFQEGKQVRTGEESAAKAAFPGTFKTGDIVGSIAGGIAPVALVPKLGRAAQTVRGAGALGATEAGLRQVGEEEDATLGAAGRTLGAAAVGGTLAAGGQAIMNSVMSRIAKRVAGRKVSEAADDIADEIKVTTTADPAKGPVKIKAVIKEIPESTDDAAKAASKTLKNASEELKAPAPVPEEKAVAKISGRDAEDIAYFRSNRERILKTPPLDESAEMPMSSVFADDFAKLDARIAARESAAQSLLEQSDASISTDTLRSLWLNQANIIRNSGKYSTPAGRSAVALMKRQAELLPEGQAWSGSTLREYVQGLWETNKDFFTKAANPNAKPTFAQRQFEEVATKRVNEALKLKIPGYREIMDDYAKELRVLLELKKNTNVNNWFKNRILKPVADFVDGVATTEKLYAGQKSWLSTLKDFNDLVGRDYFKMIKDRLVMGRVLPEQVSGGDLGPLTNQFGRSLGSLVTGRGAQGLAQAVQSGREVAAKSSDKVLEIFLMNPEAFTTKMVTNVVVKGQAAKQATKRGAALAEDLVGGALRRVPTGAPVAIGGATGAGLSSSLKQERQVAR